MSMPRAIRETKDFPEVHEVNDSASIEEINLFAYALALGDSLVDEKILARTDILRPADFAGDTMKELVSDLLAILDRTGDVTFARI